MSARQEVMWSSGVHPHYRVQIRQRQETEWFTTLMIRDLTKAINLAKVETQLRPGHEVRVVKVNERSTK